MGEHSKIEWTHHTLNPWRGCTKVSAGCAHCYAETMSKRNPSVLGVWGPRGRRVVAAESYWQQPLKWNADAERAGERRRVFCASLADVFEGEDTMPAESWPLVQAARARLFELIEQTPALDWLLLTKRPENTWQNAYTPISWWERWPRNVWLGTSVENQEQADKRIPHLLRAPAAVRFLSCEPLLGPVNLDRWLMGWSEYHGAKAGLREAGKRIDQAYEARDGARSKLHWVIAGGESGAHARPMHQRWVRSLRDQCSKARVAFFFKQHGEWIGGGDWEYDTMNVLEERSLWAGQPNDPDDLPTLHYRVGKHVAGRLLDYREWNELPSVTRNAE